MTPELHVIMGDIGEIVDQKTVPENTKRKPRKGSGEKMILYKRKMKQRNSQGQKSVVLPPLRKNTFVMDSAKMKPPLKLLFRSTPRLKTKAKVPGKPKIRRVRCTCEVCLYYVLFLSTERCKMMQIYQFICEVLHRRSLCKGT